MEPRNNKQPTTAQQLGSLIKSARDIMRKDKGLSGDLDRLPMLTWIMFLKFLDDMEQIEESRAKLGRKKYRPAIEPPYRWRDWAANEQGITGPELLAFINQEEATRPDGSKGPGLFAYLRSLRAANGRGDRRTVIATVFNGVINRMTSGYLLRDVINKVGGIHFTAQEELFTLGSLYESMLKEMRDAAGDNGEFYTPRAVVRFMVDVIDPRLGRNRLGPRLRHGRLPGRDVQPPGQAVQDGPGPQGSPGAKHLRRRGEAAAVPAGPDEPAAARAGKPADRPREQPAVPAQRNRRPRPGGHHPDQSALRRRGGTRHPGQLPRGQADGGNRPAVLATHHAEAAAPAAGRGSERGLAGGCAVVVPNGTLFGDGVCARIKAQLLEEFNLHTIVRLPNGVFAPYTSIPTNLLFFDRSGPTKCIWYYEMPLPEGRKNYTKTKPIQYEEFAECLAWWKKRKENGRAWKVKAAEFIKTDDDGNLLSVNLDIKNPNAAEALEHLPPEQLVEDILVKEQRIIEIMGEIKKTLAGAGK